LVVAIFLLSGSCTFAHRIWNVIYWSHPLQQKNISDGGLDFASVAGDMTPSHACSSFSSLTSASVTRRRMSYWYNSNMAGGSRWHVRAWLRAVTTHTCRLADNTGHVTCRWATLHIRT